MGSHKMAFRCYLKKIIDAMSGRVGSRMVLTESAGRVLLLYG